MQIAARQFAAVPAGTRPRRTAGLRKPFSGSRPAQHVARAAEADAPAEPAPVEDDFAFNFSDAKKANDYSNNDVEAAMAYFAGEGSASEIENEFVTVPREFSEAGVEDASYFDEYDNNEAYDDEFVAAGIPEAAPKTKRNERPKEGEAEGDDDNMVAAKEAQQLKEAEEQMVLEAELEEMGLDKESTQSSAVVGPAVWDWMGDVALDEEDDATVAAMVRNPVRLSASVAAALPTDDQLFTDMRTTQFQDIDAETKETIDFLLDDFDIEGELKAIPDGDEEVEVDDIPEVPALDMAAIDALLATDVSVPDMGDLSLAGVPLPKDDGLDLDEAEVASYIAALKAVDGVEMDESEVKALFGDAPVTQLVVADEAAITIDDADLAEPAALQLGDWTLPEALVDNVEDEDDVSDYKKELLSLASIKDEDVMFDAPSAEEIEVLDQYLTASEQFLANEDIRKEALAQAVARGELSPDALDEEIEDFADGEADVLANMVENDDDEGADFDDDDNENWQERIVEMSRVTKVVKGGKLMGFRVVAIVGNGKGLVGVGCQSGREVATAVKRALVDAKKSVVRVPIVGAGTIPHRVEAKYHAARCVVVPAADGTGCLAGGSIRSVLELAGVQNVLAKRIGCRSALNNARATVAALEQLRTLQEVAKYRGVPMSNLLLPQ